MTLDHMIFSVLSEIHTLVGMCIQKHQRSTKLVFVFLHWHWVLFLGGIIPTSSTKKKTGGISSYIAVKEYNVKVCKVFKQ